MAEPAVHLPPPDARPVLPGGVVEMPEGAYRLALRRPGLEWDAPVVVPSFLEARTRMIEHAVDVFGPRRDGNRLWVAVTGEGRMVAGMETNEVDSRYLGTLGVMEHVP